MKTQLHQIQELLETIPKSYMLAKQQAQKIDHILGFNCDDVEKSLKPSANGKMNWSHLHVQAHQTPYSELLEICQYLQPHSKQTFMDIGAGYCRLGIVLQIFYPEAYFVGYELVPERIEEAKRIYRSLDLKSENLWTQDVAEDHFKLPHFDYALIYDFGSQEDIQKVLQKLQQRALEKTICVVARGKGIRHQILTENPWLTISHEPYHTEHWSVFRS